ncbi:F-box only protein 6-like [Papaver somniferum]|uniref:F-box only protein 6-like n=1 Tax=Papaver somniferum TaxID=3469 RepID=UPI000E6F7AEA|nr:F-box only protein 6-like [Papaver somniferum]
MHVDAETISSSNPWEKLDDAMVERLFLLIPISEIFAHCQFVSKRWNSVIHSPTFSIVSKRPPWFIIFDVANSNCLVYDMEVSDYRRPCFIDNFRIPTELGGKLGHPFASSGGLVCFFGPSEIENLIVCNPFRGLVRSLPKFCVTKKEYVRGIAIHALGSNYKVFIVHGIWPDLGMNFFSSEDKEGNWIQLPLNNLKQVYESMSLLQREVLNDDNDLVQFKGVTSLGKEGQILVYFIILKGIILCFDTLKYTICKYPRLLGREFVAIDMAVCCGKVYLVVLMEPLVGISTSTSHVEIPRRTLRIWEFADESREWKHTSAMPSNMCQEYDIEAHLICAGHDDYIMVCINSTHDNIFHQILLYNIKKNTWSELVPDFDDDNLRIVWGYCFKPDIDAKV